MSAAVPSTMDARRSCVRLFFVGASAPAAAIPYLVIVGKIQRVVLKPSS